MADPVSVAGRSLFLVGVLTSTWTEITVSGQMVGDIALFSGGALLLFGAHATGSARRGPAFLQLSSYMIVVSALMAALVGTATTSGVGVAIRFATVLWLVPLLTLQYVRNERDAFRVLLLLAVSAAVNSAVAVGDLVFGMANGPAQLSWNESPEIASTRAVGLTGHPNILGLVAVSVLPITPALVLAFKRRRPLLTLPILLGALLTVGALALSGSRGAALAIVGAGVAIAFQSESRRVRWAVVVGGVLALAVIGGLLNDSSLVSRLANDAGAAASNDARGTNISEAWNLMMETFPFGGGFENATAVHSGVLAIAASGGILAVGGIGLWAHGVRGAFRRGVRSAAAGIESLIGACRGAGVALAIFFLFAPIVFHRYVVLPLAVGLAVSRFRRADVGVELQDGASEERPSVHPV